MGIVLLSSEKLSPIVSHSASKRTYAQYYVATAISFEKTSRLEPKTEISKDVHLWAECSKTISQKLNPVAYISSVKAQTAIDKDIITTYEKYRCYSTTGILKDAALPVPGAEVSKDQHLQDVDVALAHSIGGYAVKSYTADTPASIQKDHDSAIITQFNAERLYTGISRSLKNGRPSNEFELSLDVAQQEKALLDKDVVSSFPIGGRVTASCILARDFDKTSAKTTWQAPTGRSVVFYNPPGVRTRDRVYTTLDKSLDIVSTVTQGFLTNLATIIDKKAGVSSYVKWYPLADVAKNIDISVVSTANYQAKKSPVIEKSIGGNIARGYVVTSQAIHDVKITPTNIFSVRIEAAANISRLVITPITGVYHAKSSAEIVKNVDPRTLVSFLNYSSVSILHDILGIDDFVLNAWLQEMIQDLLPQGSTIPDTLSLVLSNMSKEPSLMFLDIDSAIEIGAETYFIKDGKLVSIDDNSPSDNAIPVAGVDLNVLGRHKVKQLRSAYVHDAQRFKALFDSVSQVYDIGTGHRFNCMNTHYGKDAKVLFYGFSKIDLLELFLYLRERITK